MNKLNVTSFVIFNLLLATITVLSFILVQPFLVTLIMGAVIAILSWPLYQKLSGTKKRSKAASISITILIILLMLVPSTFFVGRAISEAKVFVSSFLNNDSYSFSEISNNIYELQPVKFFVDSPEELELSIRAFAQTVGKTVTASALAIASNLPSVLLQLALTAMAVFFFLIDGPRFLEWLKAKIPLDNYIGVKLGNAFRDTSVSVIWASFAASMTQSSIMFFSFLALGVPSAFLAAGTTFVFSWIPFLGSTPVWISACVYLYIKKSIGKMVAMLILGSFTSVIDNVVRSMVLKGKSEMHPLVSLVAIFGGIEMFGLLGVFIGPILTAIFVSVIGTWPHVLKREQS